MRHSRAVPVLIALLLLAGGCGRRVAPGAGGNPVAPQPPPVASDFTLTDVNPASATVGQGVSPRQQLAKVSAWYFGHAT